MCLPPTFSLTLPTFVVPTSTITIPIVNYSFSVINPIGFPGAILTYMTSFVSDLASSLASYVLGWVAYIFCLVGMAWLSLWRHISSGASTIVSNLINYMGSALDFIISDIESVSSRAGIFSPIVAAFLGGILIVAIVLGFYSAFNMIMAMSEA
ncbi:MAG: hypothetical protein M1476_01285 [Candidatus Thermoplasmatota archaeon]|nr:hypothetical protein [Candidatus Thermoplasmatota archaeon]